MYEVPDMEGIEEVVVNKDTVVEKKAPVYVFADKKKKKAPDTKEVEAV
jgi:ATP-dependent protease Clp ATPase subunit